MAIDCIWPAPTGAIGPAIAGAALPVAIDADEASRAGAGRVADEGDGRPWSEPGLDVALVDCAAISIEPGADLGLAACVVLPHIGPFASHGRIGLAALDGALLLGAIFGLVGSRRDKRQRKPVAAELEERLVELGRAQLLVDIGVDEGALGVGAASVLEGGVVGVGRGA